MNHLAPLRPNPAAHLQPLEPRCLLSHAGVELGAFGDVAGTSSSLTFADVDGTQVVVTLRGGGSGRVYSDGQAVDVETTGTGPRSRLAIAARGGGDGRATIRDVIVTGPLRSPGAPGSQIAGNVTVTGTTSRLHLGDLGDNNPEPAVIAPSRTLTVGGGGNPVSLVAGNIEKLAV